MEKINIKELEDDLMQDEDFRDTCEHESFIWALILYLRDATNLLWNEFPKGGKFEFIEAYREKGDGKDVETFYGIFKRKSDGKFFRVCVHDRGFIGPSTLSMSDYMEEVKPKEETRKIKTWDNF